MKRIAAVLYGIGCYVFFLVTFLYAVGFVGNFGVPKQIDDGQPLPSLKYLLFDVVLLSIFALQHSIMARPGFKKWWTKIIPPSIERSTYVLVSSLALVLIFWKWHSFNGIIWKAESAPLQYTLTTIYFAGWLIVLLATFMINHFDLFGLRQVFYHFKNKSTGDPAFTTNWFYRIVRHPIMLGFLIAFWATPVMTTGHLLFSIVTSAYILVAIKFLEEKDLEKSIGEKYKAYQRSTPMLVPFTKKVK